MTSMKIFPVKEIDGAVSMPGSKSYTNRALAIGALCKGRSVIRNALLSDDTANLMQAIAGFGIEIERDGAIAIHGKGGILKAPASQLDLGGSGTGLRLCISLAALCPGRTVLDGDQSLRKRPQKDIIEGLAQLGIRADSRKGYIPVAVSGGTSAGGSCVIDGSGSSQSFSSLLLIGPYLKKGISIRVKGDLVSRPYIDMTLAIMEAFGVRAENKGYKEFSVQGGQGYAAQDYTVEGDASSATYFLAAAAIAGGRICVKNVPRASLQPDARFIDILARMGCKSKERAGGMELSSSGRLTAIDVDMMDMPDSVPALAVCCAFAEGTSVIRNIRHLRLKESDRIKSVAEELRKTGARVIEREDSLEIASGMVGRPFAEIGTHSDHRIAMALSIAGLRKGIVIRDPEVVGKSFPGYWDELQKIGVRIERKE